MPKSVYVELAVPSNSRPEKLHSWLSELLAPHRMSVLTCTELAMPGWTPIARIDEAETCFIWARPNGRGGWGVGIGYRTVSGTYMTETSQPLPKDVVCWKNIGPSPGGD